MFPLFKTLSFILILFSLIGVSLLFKTHSQYRVQAKESKNPRVSAIDFEDELIEGSVRNPDLFHFSNEDELKYKRIIPLKQHFQKEIRETANRLPNPKPGR